MFISLSTGIEGITYSVFQQKLAGAGVGGGAGRFNIIDQDAMD